MKLRTPLLAISLLGTPCLAAAQPVTGLYVDGAAGADFLQNEIVHPDGPFGPSKRAYRFDTGGAGAVALGYGLGRGFRLELEGDYTDNKISGVRFPSGVPGHAIGSEQQYGGFLNALCDLDLGLPVTPYLGIGAGYQEIELDRINSAGLQSPISSTLSSSQGAFAYQAIAGSSYRIATVPGLSVTVEYRMIGVLTPPPFYRGQSLVYTPPYFGALEPSRAKFSNIFNHQALLGLRYEFGGRPAPVPIAAVPALPVAPAPEPVRTYLVFFDWDRSDLTTRARQIVAEAAQASMRVQSTRIEVDGYTDLSGTAAYNQGLSLRRARSIEAELVKDGIGRDQVGIHGYGESNPLVQTAQGVREPQNRRVEIILR